MFFQQRFRHLANRKNYCLHSKSILVWLYFKILSLITFLGHVFHYFKRDFLIAQQERWGAIKTSQYGSLDFTIRNLQQLRICRFWLFSFFSFPVLWTTAATPPFLEQKTFVCIFINHKLFELSPSHIYNHLGDYQLAETRKRKSWKQCPFP